MKKTVVLLILALLLVTACAACSHHSQRNQADQSVSAESFGADGTDSGDDRKAIQAALNYARDNATSDFPVTVNVGDGVYHLEQSLVIYSHTRLVLSSKAVLVYTGQEGLILFGGATRESYDAVTDVVISGGTWRGNAAATGAHTEPIGFHSASNITLQGLRMEDSSDHFVMLTGVSGAVVKDCTFKDHFPISDISQSSKEALHIDFLPLGGGGLLPSENITVENCRFDNVASGIGTHHYGYGKQEKNIAVKNCTFENVQYNCINAYSMVNLSISDCSAANCPVFLWCYSTECSIYSNIIRGSGEKCIAINDDSAAVVKDNKIYSIGTGSGNAAAVFVGNSSCVIEDNEISDVNGRAIRIKGGNSLSAVRGNKISFAATQGIYLVKTKAVVEKNTIENCQGILAELSETCINDNSLTDCLYGIMYSGGSSRISRNTVTHSEKSGIHITNKPDSDGSVVIENNTVTDSGDDDVRIGKNCVNCLVRDNNLSNSFRITYSKHSDIVALRNGMISLPATPFVNCSMTENDARLSWQGVEGARDYVIYSYDFVSDSLTMVAETRSLYYDIKDLPHDSISSFIVVSRNASGEECVYTYSTNAVYVNTGAAFEYAKVLYSPESISVRKGEEAFFKVKASGSGMSYKWQFRKKNSPDWSIWTGKDSSVITAKADETWDGMQVRCAVTDSGSNTVYTAPTEIIMTGDPEIIMQSGDVAAYREEPVSFSVAVRGENYKIRWYFKRSGANIWTPWDGHASSTVSTVAGDEWDGAQVRCVVSGKDGKTVYSKPVNVSVQTKLRIISQPPDRILSPEENAAFEIKAIGEGNLRYQWYYRKAGSEEWNIWQGHDAAVTYAVANDSWQGMQVKCIITDEAGAIAESRIVNISIYEY